MSFLKPDPPTPPNPYATAAAATGTNVSTAVANTMLNQVNQKSGDGSSLTYDTIGNYNWTDPTTSQTYSLPLRQATQTLSPADQSLRDIGNQAKINLAGTAMNQSARLGSVLGAPVDLSGAPARGDPNTIRNAGKAQTSFNTGGPIQSSIGGYGSQQQSFEGTPGLSFAYEGGGPVATGYNNGGTFWDTYGTGGDITKNYAGGGDIASGYDRGGDITQSYGPADNFSADRQRYEDSLMQRMNPQLSRERGNIEQRLADQGIRYGSQAYTSAMDDYNRQANDARFAAVGQAGSEQQRMNQMAQQQAQFQNAAQQQGYSQNAALAGFQNAAQQQAESQNAARAGFQNSAQQQANAQNYQAAQFANSAQQQANTQNKEAAQFQNAAQQQTYGQNAQSAAFWNSAQGQAYAQAQGRGQFANEAQQRMYDQAMGAGTFANAAQGQQFGQNAQAAQFYNAGQAQNLNQAQSAFNADQTARNQYAQEQYANRNQTINETTALMSGSQVNQPNWINTPGSQIATTDVAGLMNQNFQNQMGIYNTQMGNVNTTVGGLLGAAGTAAGGYLRSDRRSKENIKRVGTVFSTNENNMARVFADRKELPVYSYSYKDDPMSTRHIGPMAQDVEKADRGAVVTIDGVKHINPKRVMGNILRAA